MFQCDSISLSGADNNSNKNNTKPMSAAFEPFVVTCQDGIVLKGRRYIQVDHGEVPENRILCWHGWMDNCQTFWKLAPALLDGMMYSASSSSVDLVALDFPGHGHSSHKSLDGPSMMLMDYVYYVHEVLQALKWAPETVTLIGHSMGGAISLMYAAAFPVQKLIMLDSLGPYVKEGGAAKHLRTHIKARLRGKDPSSVYESLDQAVEVRMLTATTFPGNQHISKEAATQLVQGASKILPDGRLEFLHDQRLKMPSILYLTQEQVDEMYKSVAESETSVCLLLAQEGMPFPPQMVSHVQATLQPKILKALPGSHHFHADPDSASGVAETILEFLQ